MQIVLCWQEDGRYLVIHDRGSETAIAFLWDADRLQLLGEASRQRLDVLERNAFKAVIIPYEDGLIEHGLAERAGHIDKLLQEIQWRYGTKLDHMLDMLLMEACNRMREIEGDLGVSYADHRFNDAGGDDN